MKKYDQLEISRRRSKIAQGDIYDENSLRVAKDMPCLNPEDRSILDAFMTGINNRDPFWYRMRLQDISIKIWQDVSAY